MFQPLVLFTVLTLFSCESQDSETITFQSTDNRLKVLVSGQRYSSLDPCGSHENGVMDCWAERTNPHAGG